MKKIILLSCGVLCVAAVFAQQRLAAFALGATEGFTPSVCLDYFREAPGFDSKPYSFHSGGGADGLEFAPQGYDRVAITRNGQAAKLGGSDPVYLSSTADLAEISPQKKDFIKDQYEHLKASGPFTGQKLSKAQDKIWAFDVLEKLGYIDPSLPAKQAYAEALQKFTRDFGQPGKGTVEDAVLDVADHFGSMYEHPKDGGKSVILAKTPVTRELLAFDGIARPFFRGASNDGLLAAVNNLVSDDDQVQIKLIGFETPQRETAQLLNLKRKLELVYHKDVVLSNNLASNVWDEDYFSISRPFTDASITATTVDGQPALRSSLEVEGLLGDRAEVEGFSNQHNLLSAFFTKLSASIKSTKDAFTLGSACRSIRKQVLSAVNAPGNNDYLNCLIIQQGVHKDVVRIDLKKWLTRLAYVQNGN